MGSSRAQERKREPTANLAVASGRRNGPAKTRLPAGLFAYVWQESRHHQLWLCLLAVGVFLLTLAPIDLQRRIVDQAIGGEDLRLLAVLGAIYLIVVLLSGGLKYLLRVYRGSVSERAVRSLRKGLYAGLLESDRRGAARPHHADQGRVIPIVAAEAERVGGFVGESFSEPTLQLGILLSVFGYMLWVEPLIALVSLIFFVPQMVLVPIIQRAVNRRAKRKVQLIRSVGESIVEEAETRADPEAYGARIDDVYRTRISYFRLKFLLKFLNNLMNHLGPLSVLMVGGYMVINGTTTVGTVVAFISGFERMADPTRRLLAYYHLAAESQVQYRLIADQLRRQSG